MSTQTFTMTEEIAANVLGKMKIYDAVGMVENVLITNISENSLPIIDADGNDTGRVKFIANFRAMSSDQMDKATALFEAGAYQDACNQTLSFNLTPEQKELYSKGQMVNLNLDEVFSNEQQDYVLRVVGISKAQAIKAKTNKFAKAKVVMSESERAEAIAKHKEAKEALKNQQA